MAPTPLTANWRVTFKYTVDNFTHKAQYYLETSLSADPSGFNTLPRPGFAPVGVSTLGDRFFGVIAPFYAPADTTFDSWELWGRSGTVFVFLSAGAISSIPTGTVAYQKANGYCVAGKDDDNKNMPHYMYEGAFGTALKVRSVAGLVSAARLYVNYHFNPDVVATDTDAYAWSESRGGALADRWLAAIVDTNESLRRKRGIK